MASLAARYLDYVGGDRAGALTAIVRSGLSVLALPYRLCCSGRLALYNNGLLLSRELDARVISVGNITAGGTGKTPLVIWLARWLQQRSISTAILSRGYGRRGPSGLGQSDEMLLFRRYLPRVPHLVGKNRFVTGCEAVEQHGAECLLLDDGFQHLAVGRDLDIVLIDSLMPFGHGRLLPRGLLREPLSGLHRADLIVLTRCELCPKDQLRELRRRIREICGCQDSVESLHRPVRFYRHGTEESRPLGWAQGTRVYAFSALGNPVAFPRTLEHLGAEVLHHQAFRDHRWYDEADLSSVARAATEAGADAIVTTEKDAVKIQALPNGAPPLYVLAIELGFIHGEELLVAALEDVVQG
jgi:tetraacyldisaccharide 4'-kinase